MLHLTARDVTGFYAFSPARRSASFSTFWVDFLLDYTDKLEKKNKKFGGEISKNPMEMAPRNWKSGNFLHVLGRLFFTKSHRQPGEQREEILWSRSLGHGVRKNGVCNRVRIDDGWSILKFRIGFPFGKNSAWFCQFGNGPNTVLESAVTQFVFWPSPSSRGRTQ